MLERAQRGWDFQADRERGLLLGGVGGGGAEARAHSMDPHPQEKRRSLISPASMSLFIPLKRKGPNPAKVRNLQTHRLILGRTSQCPVPCPASYLLAPIPRGPHPGISLAGAVPPDVKLDPDLVHCSAQFCQSCEREKGDGICQ